LRLPNSRRSSPPSFRSFASSARRVRKESRAKTGRRGYPGSMAVLGPKVRRERRAPL